MTEPRVFEAADELPGSFATHLLPRRAPDGRVLMVHPGHYDVAYAINPHMKAPEGGLRRPDRVRALGQWDELRRTYEALGFPVVVFPGLEGLPDMVFVANVAVTVAGEGGRPPRAIMSRMHHPERRGELAPAEAALGRLGFEIVRLPDRPDCFCEGHGDILWFSDKALLFGGHGFRTELMALREVSALAGVPVVALRLVDPLFYHLDTCLLPLDGQRVGWVPEAFDERGRALLQRVVPRLIDVRRDEAEQRLAANAHCVDGRNVIIDAGCKGTSRLLEAEGFKVHGVDTSEFLKAGGSVFCMKLMLPAG